MDGKDNATQQSAENTESAVDSRKVNIQITSVRIKSCQNTYKYHPYIVLKRETEDFVPPKSTNTAENAKNGKTSVDGRKPMLSSYLQGNGSTYKIQKPLNMIVYWQEPNIVLDCQIFNDKVSDGGQLVGQCKLKVYPKEEKDMYVCDYRLVLYGREAGKVTIKVVNLGGKKKP